MKFLKIFCLFSLISLVGCKETEIEEKIVTETVTETVIVEKQPHSVTFTLTALDYELQDDYPVVINDGEIPKNIHFNNIDIYVYYLDENDKWSKSTRYSVGLDKNQFDLELYHDGVYSFYIQGRHYATNGEKSFHEYFTQHLILDIQKNEVINVNLVPRISENSLLEQNLSGERTATVYDYLIGSDKVCHKLYNQHFSDYFYTKNGQHMYVGLFCKEEALLSEIHLDMDDDVRFTVIENLLDETVSYPGSSIIYPNKSLNIGFNYFDFKVNAVNQSHAILNVDIDSMTIDTASEQQVLTDVVNDTKYMVEKPEFYVPDTQEIVLMALYDYIILDEICTNQQEYKINGELIQSDYYSSEKEAYCYKPTGLEGQNVFLDIFPRTEVSTWRGWIFESDEPGLKLMYAKGHSSFTNSDGEYPVSEWFAE